MAGILAHPYVAECDAALTRTMHEEIVRDRRISVDAAWLGRNELLKRIFSPAAEWRELSDYLLGVIAAVARQPYEGDDARQRVEFLAVIAEQVTKLRNSLDECDIELATEVYTSLLRRHLQTLRIPFEGEPLEGIQIMGILETRNVDFENVILLSMNDDNFPGNHVAQSSFIPYNLRAAYELPTPEHHEGVYAYYFYRLIQRAKSVHMLYCSHADDKSTGEPSRYIYQLDYESGFDVRRIEVGVDVPNASLMVIENAERFGLSQLHQLRGRVGRGSHKSYCVLVSDNDSPEVKARLGIMKKTGDGFKISEEDLRLRGPGDFFGSRQHGLPEMHVADLGADINVLQQAQDESRRLLELDPELSLPEHSALRDMVDRLYQANRSGFN